MKNNNYASSISIGSLTTKFGPISEINEKPNIDKY